MTPAERRRQIQTRIDNLEAQILEGEMELALAESHAEPDLPLIDRLQSKIAMLDRGRVTLIERFKEELTDEDDGWTRLTE